jgi:hypothetical protein
MPTKRMKLKRDGTCVDCDTELPAGTKAEWDSDQRTVSCLTCVDARPEPPTDITVAIAAPAEAPPLPPPPIEEVDPSPIDVGVPGASARKEHQRRQAKHEKRIEEKWGTGRLGKIAKALSDDPQTTRAWKEGAVGEERVAQILQERLGDSAVLLHDRKVPGTRGNIDHIAIAASGVWIIDAKRYKGRVEKRDKGGWFSSDLRLYVGGRDKTTLVEKMGWQNDAVRTALGEDDVPLHRTLTFVGAEWPLLFRKPLQFDGVWVSWPAKLADLIAEPGPLEPEEVERIARHLADKLPANRA